MVPQRSRRNNQSQGAFAAFHLPGLQSLSWAQPNGPDSAKLRRLGLPCIWLRLGGDERKAKVRVQKAKPQIMLIRRVLAYEELTLIFTVLARQDERNFLLAKEKGSDRQEMLPNRPAMGFPTWGVGFSGCQKKLNFFEETRLTWLHRRVSIKQRDGGGFTMS